MNIKLNKLFLLGAALISLISSCTSNPEDVTLATIDNGSVKHSEYQEFFLISAQYKPEKFPTLENLKEIVELKAIEKMSVQEALEEEIDQDSTYKSIAKSNERRLIYQQYVNVNFTSSIITDSLIQKFYSEYTPQYNMKYIMRPIIKSSDAAFIEDQKNTIWEAYKELNNGSDFASVTKKYSQDKTTNQKGGDLGWIILESMGDHVVRTVMDTLSSNTYSVPFRGFGGYYILYKGDHREVKVPRFEDIKDKIWKSLYRSRRGYIQEALDNKFKEFSKKYNYKLNKNEIEKALKKAGYNSRMSEYKGLNFSKLTDNDKTIKIAEYSGGYILLGDLFANRKKAPENKYEFNLRLEKLAEVHIISMGAMELNLHESGELPKQLDTMRESLLRAILFQKKVGEKVEIKLKEIKAEKDPGKRTEVTDEFREEYEDYLKTKYNFTFKEENFDVSIELATESKKEQNREKELKNKQS